MINDKCSEAESDWRDKIDLAVTNADPDLKIVFPETVASLSEVVTEAKANKSRILIAGRGTKLDWGNLSQNIQLLVSIQKCDRLIEHAVGDLTVTVEAGMKLTDLQTILRSQNQFLPIDPLYPESATIGGIIATGDTGSWRQGYGGIRDLLLGISFVRADGAIAKAGGRVVKNVAGYDLMKLFTGAYGTLGIISQATFRTYAIPQASETILLQGASKAIERAVKTIRNSGLTPTAMDLISASVSDRLGSKNTITLAIRFQTIPESIAGQIQQITAIAKELNLSIDNYTDDGESELWRKLQEVVRIPQTENSLTCKIGILPTEAVSFLDNLATISANESLALIHAGSGIGQLQLTTDNLNLMQKLRSSLRQKRGFLTIATAPKQLKSQLDIWGYGGNALSTMRSIKDKFDPDGILNPERFLV